MDSKLRDGDRLASSDWLLGEEIVQYRQEIPILKLFPTLFHIPAI